MSIEPLSLTPKLVEYLHATGMREPVILQELRVETAFLPQGHMQISPPQGQLLGFLLELMGAQRVLEVGTFTGYSALAMALRLPKNGTVITCDCDPVNTKIAKKYWEKAGLSSQIELKLAPALETLQALLAQKVPTFDFVFIDADKENQLKYYELALQLVRTGGVIAIDNVLWYGRVVDPSNQTPSTEAIRALNQHIHADSRVEMVMLSIGDGLTLVRKL